MTRTFKTTALAIGLAVATSFVASAAFAGDVVVTFDPSTVQYGYTDGYWSKTHEWHTWEKPEYVQTYRALPGARYNEYVHTRDANQGWIDIPK